MANKSALSRKERNELADMGIGALSGGLMAIGINPEKTILSPLIGSMKGSEIIFTISSIVVMIFSIIFLSYRYKEIHMLYGISIFGLSFIGLYLMLMSNNITYIVIGLIPLIISMLLVRGASKE